MKTTTQYEIQNYFREVGSPTPETRQDTERMRQDTERLNNPHAFALTLDVRPYPRPTVTWSHNTDLHFGLERMAYEDYLGLIHPRWTDIYFAFAAAAYSMGREKKNSLRQRNVCYTVLVPLQNIDGKYYWYRQVSVPCAFDRKDNMVAHLSHYHRAEEYGRLSPGHPVVTVDDRRKYEAEKSLRNRSQQVLTKIFYHRLTQRERGVLYYFRSLHARSAGEVSNQQVSREMQLALGTINKNNTRILTKAKEVFPLNTFNTMSDLAALLNELFGEPRNLA